MIAVAVAGTSPLLLGDYALVADDGYTHTLWAQQFVSGLQQGVVRPLWAADVNAGCGSPSLLFYPPMSLYSTGLASTLAPEIPRAMRLAAALAIALSGVALFGCARGMLPPWPAALAAVVYMAAPYHLLDLLQRTALGELWAFVFVPVVLAGVQRLDRETLGAVVVIALGYGGLLLSHLPLSVLVGLLLPVLLGYAYLRHHDSMRLLASLTAPFLGAALAGFYLVPVLALKDAANLSSLERFDVTENFLFSAAVAGTGWNRLVSLVALVTALPCVALWSLEMARRGPAADRGRALSHAVLGLALLLGMTPLATPLWRGLPLLAEVGFPWRLLVPMTALAALCTGALAARLARASVGSARRVIAALLVAVVLGLGGLSLHVLRGSTVFHPPMDWSLTAGMEEEALREAMAAVDPRNTWLRDIREYRPRASLDHAEGDALAIVMPSAFYEGQRAAWSAGQARVERWDAQHRILAPDPRAAGTLLLRTFHFPGWQAWIDGSPRDTAAHPGSGLLLLEVPAGTAQVTVRFTHRSLHLGGAMSVATALLLLLLWWWRPPTLPSDGS